MEMSLSTLTVQLAKDATMRMDAARGVRLYVRSGRLWLTEEGLRDDVFLGPGQSWTLRGPGRAVVQAEQPAAIDLAEPRMRWRLQARRASVRGLARALRLVRRTRGGMPESPGAWLH